MSDLRELRFPVPRPPESAPGLPQATAFLLVCADDAERLAAQATREAIRSWGMTKCQPGEDVSRSMTERPPRSGQVRLPRLSGTFARPRGARAPARLRPRPPARVQRF